MRLDLQVLRHSFCVRRIYLYTRCVWRAVEASVGNSIMLCGAHMSAAFHLCSFTLRHRGGDRLSMCGCRDAASVIYKILFTGFACNILWVQGTEVNRQRLSFFIWIIWTFNNAVMLPLLGKIWEFSLNTHCYCYCLNTHILQSKPCDLLAAIGPDLDSKPL